MEITGRLRFSQIHAIAIGVGLLSLGLSLWQLTVPGLLNFPDSGVYFAASFHLVTGAMPYRDFTFVQPPGILLLMSPVTLISRLIGTHDGFILARVVDALVTALNASLLAWLIRHRGRTAMVVAGAGLALMPVAAFVSSGVRLEPFLVCFILLGSLAVFSRNEDRDASTRQLVVCGLLFGAAALVKLWALFPFIALIVCLVPRYRRRIFIVIGAAAAGFTAVCLPFFLSAPRSFISQVFVEQINRKANTGSNEGFIFRLKAMSGFLYTSLEPTSKEVVIAFVALLLFVVIAYARRVEHETVDIFLLLAGLLSVGGLLVASNFYEYYAYFTAPFLFGVLGICLARVGAPIRALLHADRASQGLRRIGAGLCTLGGAALVVALLSYGTSFYSSFTPVYGETYPYSAITNLIPAGSCVLYSQVSYGVFSDRLASDDSSCPNVVDPNGMWLAWGDGLIAAAPNFTAEWKSYFESSQYVVMTVPYAQVIPWDQSLTSWFASNYYLLYGQSYVYIYAKDA